MRLEDLDYDALINQMWGSEANLQSYLDSEVPNLCARICGPEAPVPMAKVTYPPLKGKTQQGVAEELSFASALYHCESEGIPAVIRIPAIIAGNKPKLPQFIAIALIHHWETLDVTGELVVTYPEAADSLFQDSSLGMSEDDLREAYSPRFVAKAAKVARDFEMPLKDFLFPKISLKVYMPRPEEGTAEST